MPVLGTLYIPSDGSDGSDGSFLVCFFLPICPAFLPYLA